jgi:hypothetical protein
MVSLRVPTDRQVGTKCYPLAYPQAGKLELCASPKAFLQTDRVLPSFPISRQGRAKTSLQDGWSGARGSLLAFP